MLRTKLFIFAFLTLVLAQSCTRETPEGPTVPTPEPNGVIMNHYNIGDLSGQLINMNDTFLINNKTGSAPLSYTYRAYAEPVTFPTMGGTETLSASAIFSMNDVVFVTWHTTQSDFGGAICAYKQSGIGRYTFMDRVDFPDASYYEVSASENSSTGYYEVFMVGQRDQSSSNYLLADHAGAVVTRIDYDYINDEFWEPSAKELPLPGVAANDIVAAAAHYYIITGNGIGNADGGLYQIDRNMSAVEKGDLLSIDDGIALIVNPLTQSVNPGANSYAEVFTLDRSGSEYRIKSIAINYDYTTDQTNFTALQPYSTSNGITMGTNDGERGDLTWAQGIGAGASKTDSLIIAAGIDGIFEAGPSQNSNFSSVANFGPCLSTEFDAGSGLLYYADGADGVKVLAMGQYVVNNPTTNLYDVIGNFVPPTSASGNPNLPNTFYIKEISLYRSRNIALATGDAGVYFLQKNRD